MNMFKKIGLVAGLSLAVLTAQAEMELILPEVSEARTRSASTAPEVSEVRTRSASTAPQLSANPDSYDLTQQIQWMQEELQTLRGMLEVSENEIQQLHTRQRDLYADLDQRISEIRQDLAEDTSTAKPEPLAAVAPSADGQVVGEVLAVQSVSGNSEQEAYQAAYSLLQNQRYAAAIDAFDAYLQDNPEGQYTANAYYWLGETHVIYDDLDKAEASFQAVIERYPLHQKAGDAMLKLGYVYDAAGQYDQAIATLTQVKQKYPNSSVARLADQRVIQIKQNVAIDPMAED